MVATVSFLGPILWLMVHHLQGPCIQSLISIGNDITFTRNNSLNLHNLMLLLKNIT